MNYTEFFGMKQEPFVDDFKIKDLMLLQGTKAVKQKMDYVLKSGGIMVVTGDVGIGKSTAIRWSLSQYHKSEIICLYVVASNASSNELYKQLCWALQLNIRTGSKSVLIKEFKAAIAEIVKQKKSKVLVIIDEASLLKVEVFAELHTINQYNFDSIKYFSMVLVGQNSLLDKLRYRTSSSLASRVVTRAHLPVLKLEEMNDYINHHIKISGLKTNLFSDNSITAIWQGSGGLLRKANFLAKGALYACMIDQEDQVTEEHVRKASTELI